MKQVNFVIIFVICLALVLFGIENTELVPIRIVKDIQFQAPLSIELILAMGIGAVLAWVFSVWTRLQRMVEVGKDIRVREDRIQALEKDVEHYKAEIEQQRLLPAAQSDSQTTEAEFVS
ncbi:LapA family protein [Phormidium sp. CLA17]|uniref:LapA family protein n=1 Tax=Leptolyngbya sp. Cla-17 TaxID=2803751 RepID=UPI001492A755|nr:LapA family protein [Leptolyngbya sp. Cla-17]MBM0743587.1 LapA family protein [Leptolyngbya sp. Cla-17]